MKDIESLGLTIIIFLVIIYFGRNDLKNWKSLSGLHKSYLLRPLLLCICVVIILILKIVNEW